MALAAAAAFFIAGSGGGAPSLSSWQSRAERLGPMLASWQTVGGCGAGASSGTGGGVKWIGRNVRGGLFHVECQANYVRVPDGYQFIGTALVTHDLTPSWTLGVSVPYLYKYMDDPFRVGVDLANKGPGDVNMILTHRLGQANAWSATVNVGAPTGTHDVSYRMQPLPQDRQLGLKKWTAGLTVDHTIDNLWGPVVLGGNVNWRGGENELLNYRSPSATLYSYVSYLVGPFAPAIGVSATSYLKNDRDRGTDMALPWASIAANASIEYASDWWAVLIGASLPYDYAVRSATGNINRWGAWIAALGFAFAPF